MSSKMCPKFALTVLFAALALSSSAQVAPSATGGAGWTVAAGAGVSDFHMDYNTGEEWGGTLWVDGNRRIDLICQVYNCQAILLIANCDAQDSSHRKEETWGN